MLKKAVCYLMTLTLTVNPVLGGLIIWKSATQTIKIDKKTVATANMKPGKPMAEESSMRTASQGPTTPPKSQPGQNVLLNFKPNPAPTEHNERTNGAGIAKQRYPNRYYYRLVPENQVDLLARIIHAEAWGEPFIGQVAVGAVLLNRIESGRFPRTLAENIFKKGEFESVSNGYIWAIQPSARSYKAARLALRGWDPSYGSLYFFNPAKSSSNWIWSRPITLKIGRHYFAR